MKAAMAAVLVMEKEGVRQAFGVPGAASIRCIALRERQTIAHVLARHGRRRIAHGRGLHACTARQHRCVHRHVGPAAPT